MLLKRRTTPHPLDIFYSFLGLPVLINCFLVIEHKSVYFFSFQNIAEELAFVLLFLYLFKVCFIFAIDNVYVLFCNLFFVIILLYFIFYNSFKINLTESQLFVGVPMVTLTVLNFL